MRYFDIKGFDKKASEFVLGTWAFGGAVFGDVDDAESINTIHYAQERGVNVIDSAPFYSGSEDEDGRAERVVGEALKGRRDDWIISTKFGRHLQKGKPWWDLKYDFTGKNAVESCEKSLKRFQTDHLDLLYVHSPVVAEHEFDPEDVFSAMEKLKKDGKIKMIGYSFGNEAGESLAKVEPYLKSGLIDVVQIRYHLMHPEPIETLFPVVSETNTAVLAREVLAGGMLIDGFDRHQKFAENHRFASMPKSTFDQWANCAEEFKFINDSKYGLTSLQMAAHHWIVSQKQISGVVTGCKNRDELEQVLASAETQYLSEEFLAKINSIQQRVRSGIDVA